MKNYLVMISRNLLWRKILGYICTVLNKFKFKDLIQIHQKVQDAQNMWNFHLQIFRYDDIWMHPPSPSNPTHTLFLRGQNKIIVCLKLPPASLKCPLLKKFY